MPRKTKKPIYEKYSIERSPFSQKPTQRDLASLLGLSRDELRRHASYKDQCIVRREAVINGKKRKLAYPVGPLRTVHEKLKFHLNKIKQPNYLFSPRKGRGQRDNAKYHLGNKQYLSLDLKQFYPSTTFAMIKSWLRDELGMYEDVAGLFATLATVDGVASFGSPLTPVLVSHVHQRMFNQIAFECESRALTYSVWVDDLTISGEFVTGELLTAIREIVANHGLKSHKILFQFGNRPVFVTGIGVVGKHLVAPQSLHLRLKHLWEQLHSAQTVDEKEYATQKLLAQLGTLRHIAGANSEKGQKAADSMNSLRQKRDKWRRSVVERYSVVKKSASNNAEAPSLPWT